MLKVCCAIIESEGKVLATQRGPGMNLAGKWEFPGGKMEAGESSEACIRREIAEELNLEIIPIHRLPRTQYAEKLELIPFVCRIASGNLVLHEHQAYRWTDLPGLQRLDWAEADIEVLNHYARYVNPA